VRTYGEYLLKGEALYEVFICLHLLLKHEITIGILAGFLGSVQFQIGEVPPRD
jgi:hypothetical protein